VEQTAKEIIAAERGLECVIAGRHMVVPLSNVDQLIEYSRVALPVAREHVGGLGLYQGALLLSLSLGSQESALVATKGVLLRGVAGPLSCALEVERTLSFVELSSTAARASTREPWLSDATTSDGRDLLRLNVESLVSALISQGNA